MPKWDESLVEFMTNSERRVTRSLAASVGKSGQIASLNYDKALDESELSTHLAHGQKKSRKQRVSVRPLHPFKDNEIVTGNGSRNQVAGKPGTAVRGCLSPVTPGLRKKIFRRVDNCSMVSMVKRKIKETSDGFSGGTEEQGYTKKQEKAFPRLMNSCGCYATQITPKNERRLLKGDDSLVDFVANSERGVTRSFAASFGKSSGKSGLIASGKNDQALDKSGFSTHLVHGQKKSRKQRVSIPPFFPLPADEVVTRNDSRNQVAGKSGKAIRGFQSPVTPRLGKKNVLRLQNCNKVSRVKRKRKEICDGTEEQGCTMEQEKVLPRLMNSSGCYSTLITPKNERKLLSVDALGMPKWDDSLVEFVANSERTVTRSLAASVGNSIGKSSLIASTENDKALDESGFSTHLVHGQKNSRNKRVAVPPLPPFPDDEIVNGNDSRIQVSGKPGKAIRGCESPITPGLGKKSLQRVDNCSKVSAVNRKRKEVSDGFSGGDEAQGWTNEQEKALQVAYFAAKPTPHFWKKVAKLVPGKSAQDCFNKVHSINLTPPLTHLRSRTKGKSLSPQCESFCGVFEDEPKGRNKKKTCCKNGRQSHNTLKTVRYLLKKHTHQNQNNDGDLFSLLEPTASQTIQAASTQSDQQLSTPIRKMEKISSPGTRPSSSRKKKPLSRFRGGAGTAVVSPPVLKPIKNLALHEKYIDQLHAREAKRKAGRNRRPLPVLTQVDGNEKLNTYAVLRAAKDSLVSDAMDAIAVFNQSQVNLSEEFSDDMEEVLVDEDGDEAEDVI